MDNPVNYLTDRICAFILLESAYSKHISPKLIKINKEKLKEYGDVCFSLNPTAWENLYGPNSFRSNGLIGINSERSLNEKISRVKNKFKIYGVEWKYPLIRLEIVQDRCLLFLNRTATITATLQYVLKDINNYGKLKKNPHKFILLKKCDRSQCKSELSAHRASIVENVLKNIIPLSEWTLIDNDNAETNCVFLKVVSMASSSIKPTNDTEDDDSKPKEVMIKCGIVVDPKSKKLADIPTHQYLRIRTIDIRLMAMHKYGIRIKDPDVFNKFLQKMGQATVSIDFLEAKTSSPIRFIPNNQGGTKGASFILYNSARIETLLRTFDERVLNGTYSKLPDLADINFTLLNEEEEWQLLYGYVFTFPDLIQRCLEQIDEGSCAIHLIVRYLSGLAAIFSVYYRRVRILTESRNHLLPYVYARICLVKAVRCVLNKALSLLNIEPVEFM